MVACGGEATGVHDAFAATFAACHVFHGPANTPLTFATLAIQTRIAPADGHLDQALAQGLAAVAHTPDFAWEAQDITPLGQDLALIYRVRFNALEVVHVQHGTIVMHGENLVGITLTAPQDMAADMGPIAADLAASFTTFAGL